MTNPPDNRPPMAVAMEWVSRIITVALEMVLPGLAGDWLDKRWGTSYLALIGFALGVTVGVWHLLAISKSTATKRGPNPPEQPDSHKGPQA